jgi:hypothetical protein
MKLKKINKNYLYLMLLIIIILFFVIIYAYNSGSCKIKKSSVCNDKFCLFKKFKFDIPQYLNQQIFDMLQNKSIQKRVTINMYFENIFNCAIPNKSGVTISTQNIIKFSPDLIDFYQTNLRQFVSQQIGLEIYPTDLSLPTTCAILIYEKEGDWINWHYDYNYYNGRFFTVLIPIISDNSCTEFQFKNDDNTNKSIDLLNGNGLVFEGDFLYHRATKLCKNQKRVILSCQYVTDNSMSYLNKLRIKIKDFAYTGKL